MGKGVGNCRAGANITSDMVDEGEQETNEHAIPHRPYPPIQMSAQIPQHGIHISFPAPQPSVPFLKRRYLQKAQPIRAWARQGMAANGTLRRHIICRNMACMIENAQAQQLAHVQPFRVCIAFQLQNL